MINPCGFLMRSGSLNSIYPGIHPHTLFLTYRNDWHCNAGCDRAFKLTNSYCCGLCDFDCCLDCLNKFGCMPFNCYTPQFFPSVHNHSLQLVYRLNYTYHCNAGCDGIFKSTNSFYCQICDFDCCPNCLSKYGFIKFY